MDRNRLSDNLVDFSKTLLILVFAIFSFISGSLLETDSKVVKITYLISLVFAIMSIYCSYNGILTKINYFLNAKKEKNILLAPGKLIKMSKSINKQYLFTMISLGFLVIAVLVKFEIYKIFNKPIKIVSKEHNETFDSKLDLKIFINKYDLEIDK